MSVPFEAAFDRETGTLRLGGEIDDEAMLELHQALDEATDEGRRSVLVDLAAVTLLPSAAVGMLAVAVRRGRKSGHAVHLRAPADGFASTVLTMVGLDHSS